VRVRASAPSEKKKPARTATIESGMALAERTRSTDRGYAQKQEKHAPRDSQVRKA
jgi:hypothetical protein